MAYRKVTLRRMSPVARKYAKLLNELDSVLRRAKNLMEEIQRIELDSQALWKQHEAKTRDELTGEGLDEIGKQMLGKITKDIPF